MRIRKGFVTNSSSTSFVITNKTDVELTIVDFAIENPQLVENFNTEYDHNYSNEEVIKSAKERLESRYNQQYKIRPNSYNIINFGDEDGDAIGRIYDYILREGGESKSFTWSYHDSHR